MIKYLDLFLKDKRSYCQDRTIEYYRDTITDFIFWCGLNEKKYVSQIDYDLLHDYVVYLRDKGVKNVSVRTYYRGVKVWVRWLYNNRYIDTDYTIGLKLPRNDNEIVLPLTDQEVHIIDSVFIRNQTDNGLRNYCMFHLMLDCGLRRSEVINLHWDDISKDKIIIRNSKFNKSRIVLLPDFLYCSLNNYQSHVGYSFKGYFTDRYNNNQITINTFRKLFANLKKQSGVERVHPHLCRHTFATSYIMYNGNMEMLRLLLGHSEIMTTQMYVHLANQQKLVNADVYKIDSIYLKGE